MVPWNLVSIQNCIFVDSCHSFAWHHVLDFKLGVPLWSVCLAYCGSTCMVHKTFFFKSNQQICHLSLLRFQGFNPEVKTSHITCPWLSEFWNAGISVASILKFVAWIFVASNVLDFYLLKKRMIFIIIKYQIFDFSRQSSNNVYKSQNLRWGTDFDYHCPLVVKDSFFLIL